MEFYDVIKKRHATRKFSNRLVEEDKLNNILEAGRIAPTAKNIQPIKIYVINTEEGLSKIDLASPCRYGARTVIMVCGDKEKAYQKDNYPIYVMDASIVGTHMMLAATNNNVDNIWVEMFNEEVLRKEFSLPDNLVPVLLLPIGYEDNDCPMSPYHDIRKSLNEIVEYK